ncbi:hypothetical protein EAX61_07370 [Dokdonia sinensis]|uniref:HTH luxR-type domain-containing protein n=1 Tax=Dokdonia sinensis TaxID=2479847 RepID=A0A3M0GCU3_9FLAO|nr:LuxR C-terminal-related transcriptional regulator [Dokdonia sinensis]RMB59403.1 hypothetical protein EAX61_07370 [Dokdonia sinensis]
MSKIVFFLFSLLTIPAFGQLFSPQIDNYTYGDNQNWGINVSDGDLIFIANNRGLVRYTGQQWELLKLPKETIVRSVFNDGEIVYTGSYEEFGFWKKNSSNLYDYHSLTYLFNNPDSIGSEEFWQILKFKNNILFRSFGGLYIFDGTSISKIEKTQGVFSMSNYRDKFFVATSTDGLQELIDGRLEPLKNNQAQYLTNIKSLTSLGDKLFLYDEIKGGFIFDGSNFTPISASLNNVLKMYILNKAKFIDDNTLSFGTIKNGVLIYDLKDEALSFINKESGLNNNTVLGLDYHKGNLWVALDNGISKINLKSSYRYYFDLSGALGTVYDMAYYKGRYYLASNTGIYTFHNDDLILIEKSEGHVWNLTIINDQLFCGHNNGTYLINGDKVETIDLSLGGVYGYTEIPSERFGYLQSTYSGISHLDFNGTNATVTKVDGVDTPINAITFNTENKVWATHPYKGLFRYTLNNNYSKIIEKEDFSNYPTLNQYKTEIVKIGDKTYFSNSNKWYTYTETKRTSKFVEVEKLKDLKSIGVEENGVWFLDDKFSRSLIFYNNNFEEKLRLTDFELYNRLVANYGAVVVKNDSIRMLNLNDGFAIFNVNTIAEESLSRPIIDKVYSPNQTIPIPNNSDVEISFKDASYLTFETYTPNAFQNEMSYVLSGEMKQRQIIKNGKFILQNLGYGDYSLRISNNYETEVDKNIEDNLYREIKFTVLPPWYLSKLAFILYILLFICSGYFLYHRNLLKIRREQLELKRQYAKETQERIYELEKTNLEKQIKDKKRELTNSTASIIKKNEAIIILRNELTRLKDVSPNSYRTKKIIANSEKYINNKNDWRQFEENFKQFNADFFDNLVKKFPKLTTRDLKLCAYIKTGLTSKEIAPLMNISKRGVELHRYRLRKKLEMHSDDNFLAFLQAF